MSEPLLKVQNLRIELSLRDGIAPVIDDLSFELGAGESRLRKIHDGTWDNGVIA